MSHTPKNTPDITTSTLHITGHTPENTPDITTST